MPLAEIAKGLIAPVTDIFKAKQERKAVAEKLAGEIRLAKQDTTRTVTLQGVELAKMRVGDMQDSWKDELLLIYILVIYAMPLIFLLLGMKEQAEVASQYITTHFPPNTMALLLGSVFGISRLLR